MKTEVIRILNISKQTIRLQVKPPEGDFFLHEQQVGIAPGKFVTLPKDHLIETQINNLRANRFIKVVYDSEAASA